MNKELIAALNLLEKENGISKEVMFDAIEKSLMDEYKTQFNTVENGRVVLDRVTGDFHIYSDRKVVEKVIIPENVKDNNKRNTEKYISATEISLADARKIKPSCQIGDIVTVEVKSEEVDYIFRVFLIFNKLIKIETSISISSRSCQNQFTILYIFS